MAGREHEHRECAETVEVRSGIFTEQTCDACRREKFTFARNEDTGKSESDDEPITVREMFDRQFDELMRRYRETFRDTNKEC